MEEFTAIRTVQEISVIRHQTTVTPAIFTVEPQPALPPPPRKNKRVLNACFLIGTYTLGLGSMILGAKHVNNCPAEPKLPAFVLAFGVIGMFARLLNCVCDWRSVYDEDESPTPPWLTLINQMLLITNFIIFILVCYFTYSSLWPETKPEFASSKKYCHYQLFTACWTGCGFGIMVFISDLCRRCCCGKSSS